MRKRHLVSQPAALSVHHPLIINNAYPKTLTNCTRRGKLFNCGFQPVCAVVPHLRDVTCLKVLLKNKEANTNISFSLLFTSCESGDVFFAVSLCFANHTNYNCKV